MKFRYSIRFLAVLTLFAGTIIGLALTMGVELSNEYNMRKFADKHGGKLYYERHRIPSQLPRLPVTRPPLFSGKRIVFVDMSGTRLNDSHIPRLVELTRRLTDVSFLDVRCTEISLSGLRLLVEADPTPGLIADEEMLYRIAERSDKNGEQ